jgi:hypothetical protein
MGRATVRLTYGKRAIRLGLTRVSVRGADPSVEPALRAFAGLRAGPQLQTLKPRRIWLGWQVLPVGQGSAVGSQNWMYVPPFALVPVHVGWQDTSA